MLLFHLTGFCWDASQSMRFLLPKALPDSMMPDSPLMFNAIYRVENLISVSSMKNCFFSIKEFAESLNQVLHLAQTAGAKDPRDKVYGLLGMMTDKIRASIHPDYSETVTKEHVYMQFCYALLAASGRVDTILRWCSSSNTALPSFVPDWMVSFPRRHVGKLSWRDSSWTVHRFSDSACALSRDGLRLNIQGIVFDVVSSVSATELQHVGGSSLPETPTAQYRPTQNPSCGAYASLQDLSTALQRTLLMNHPFLRVIANPPCKRFSGQGDIVPLWSLGNLILSAVFWVDAAAGKPADIGENMEFLVQQWDHWQVFERFRQANKKFEIFGHQLRDFFIPITEYKSSFFLDTGDGDEDWKNCMAANLRLAAVSLVGRKLATTHRGYLALVPEASRAEDVVAVLTNCAFPVVLRAEGNLFRYVGECYVDGLMDGEAVLAASRGECQVQELVLC